MVNPGWVDQLGRGDPPEAKASQETLVLKVLQDRRVTREKRVLMVRKEMLVLVGTMVQLARLVPGDLRVTMDTLYRENVVLVANLVHQEAKVKREKRVTKA